MADLTPVEALLAAAKLMRERAEKATPGPWTPMVLGSEGYLVLRKHGTVRERGKARVGRFGCKDWDSDKADAEFVAAMHPLVALTVADLLDKIAHMGPMPAEILGRAGCAEAVAIARTYLGEAND